jgi:peptidoglycan hydrolase CwlO-like protein
MLKDIKEKKEQIDDENNTLKKTIEALEDRIRLLNKQIAKKDDSLKELRNFESREFKIKE